MNQVSLDPIADERATFDVFLPATARQVHSPRLVMIDQTIKNLHRRQALVYVDRGGHAAFAERGADVSFFARNAAGQRYGVQIRRNGDVDAVLVAADEEIGLHVGSFGVAGKGNGSNGRRTLLCLSRLSSRIFLLQFGDVSFGEVAEIFMGLRVD